MRYLALATDYDGTIAHDELVPSSTIDAINRLRQSGRKIILVTGRELPDLARVFHHFEIFDLIVAENGAVLYNPATREKRILAERPPDKFAEDLRARNVTGISQGDVIVATWHPHETAVLESIRDLGLELQVIFNKDAVMVLPAGVNKMTGLNHALADLKLSRHNVVGVGDAENDHAFLGCCECSVAVSNAIPALKERVDWVTDRPRGEGVEQLISRLLEDDLRSLPPNPRKHGILLGTDVPIEAEAQTILLCGLSGGGKSTFVAGFIERLLARAYQTCLIDPEGDFEDVPGFVTIGNKDNPPSYEQIFQLLDGPGSNVTVNLVGVKLQDRPAYFASLLAGSFGALVLEPNSFGIGASGAIFGLAGATFVIARGRGMDALAGQIGFLIVFNLIFSFASPRVSVGAHLGGLVGGVICALAIVAGEKGMLGRNHRPMEIAAMVAVAVVAVLGSLAVA